MHIKMIGKLLGGTLLLLSPQISHAQRLMEYLDRGVVATRMNNTQAFISWRLMATEPQNTPFNIYRFSPGSDTLKLNDQPLSKGTNYIDNTADLSKDNHYFVRTLENNSEKWQSKPFALKANTLSEPLYRVPLKTPHKYTNYGIKYLWVGDLNGDGDYDFIVDRITWDADKPQYLEAFLADGTFLWRVDLGKNSYNPYNIEPAVSTISTGHWDGVTVYDFDQDGKAEIALRGGNGVTFGDGGSWNYSSDTTPFIFMLDGMTGAMRSYIKMPTDFASAGPLAARFGVAYLDGVRPSLIGYLKNRNDDKSFNLLECAWDYNGRRIKELWKYTRPANGGADGHNTRIADIDEDGKDEVCEIGFCLESDGSLKYQLPIVHGDRFYIGKLDPNRAGLQGYGIQQDNQSGLEDYYFDAKTGKMLWTHGVDGPAGDVGRGDVGDMDPRYEGYEMWSFSKGRTIYNGPKNIQTSPNQAPWPSLRLWWDGDLLSEQINETKFEKWDYNIGGTVRLETGYKRGATMAYSNWHAFYGDIKGDWREEVIFADANYESLLIFTTQYPTDERLYSLPQNPAYRAAMTLKGYNQSHLVDYYLGHGMKAPTPPNISIVGGNRLGTAVPSSSSEVSSSSIAPSSSSEILSSSSVVVSSSSEILSSSSELSSSYQTTSSSEDLSSSSMIESSSSDQIVNKINLGASVYRLNKGPNQISITAEKDHVEIEMFGIRGELLKSDFLHQGEYVNYPTNQGLRFIRIKYENQTEILKFPR